MLCKYINYSWFPSRKHTQVLRFFQSHDHKVNSKRGPLWADLVWKSALLHKCEILEELHERLVPEVERGQVGDHLSIYVITWNNVAFHHSQCSHRLVWHPSENDVHFPCPLLHFPQPHWGVFLNLEMEGFWPNVPPGCNGCCMPRHHSWTLPGVDKAYQKTPCQRRTYQVWCGWEHVAKCRRPGRLEDYFFIYILFFCGFFCLYILYFHIINGNCIAYFCYLAVMSCCK